MKIGVLHSIMRVEEKLLLKAFEERRVNVELLNDREVIFNLVSHDYNKFDVILERCINHSRALHSLMILNDQGVKTINSAYTANICGDKLNTTIKLVKAGVPVPEVRVAFTEESALEAIEAMGLQAAPIPGSERTAIGVLGNQGYVDDTAIRNLSGVRECIHVSKPYKPVSYTHLTLPTKRIV